MPGIVSDQLRLFVGGFNPGTSTTSTKVTLATEGLDDTAFSDPAERVVGGLRQDRMEWAGFFRDDAGGIDKILGTLVGTLGIVVSYLIGTGTGARTYAGTAFMARAAPGGAIKGLVQVEAEWQPDGTWDVCRSFGPEQSQTAGTTSGSVDDSAATTGGGALYTHVLGFSGTNTYRIVLADSATGTTFVDIATANHTGTGGTRTTFTGTLRRYVRMVTTWATTGVGSATGSATYFASYGRD